MRREGRTSASQRPSGRSSSSRTSPPPPVGRRTATRARSTRLLLTTTRSAGIEQVDEVVEAPVLDRPVAPVHEQARCVPALGRPLRDQLLGQRVVELVGTHRGSLAGDARPPANGTA